MPVRPEAMQMQLDPAATDEQHDDLNHPADDVRDDRADRDAVEPQRGQCRTIPT